MTKPDETIQLVALIALAGTFLLFAAIEFAFPARRAVRGHRWATNLAMFAIDTLAVRLFVPLLMVGSAALAADRGWGLFNLVTLPGWAGITLSIITLDLALYWQHRATHRFPLLWRLHKVHHSDPQFDVTTAARFHPLEIIPSMIYKMAVVVALGLPVLGVLVFEALFNIATLFTHANFALPKALEKPVRAILVTPGMHRIHHSTRQPETDNNFGTLLSAWDRLFGTYVDRASAGPDGLTIGLQEYQDCRPHALGWSLLLPFSQMKNPPGKGRVFEASPNGGPDQPS